MPIWIVDDDQEMINAITLMLKILGYQVESFLNAPSAAKKLLSGAKPKAIFLDINMPQVTGLDFLEFVRSRKEYDMIPVVMLSTEAADVQVDKAIGLGATNYIFKPVMIEELEKVLATI